MVKVKIFIWFLFLATNVESKPVDVDAVLFVDSNEDVSVKSKDDPKYGAHFQGDIQLNPEQEEIFLNKSGKFTADDRTGLISEIWRWPKMSDGLVNVPIEISSDFSKYNNFFPAHFFIKIKLFFAVKTKMKKTK